MKILFLFPHFLSPGGAANVVLEFAGALQKKHHTVVICCAKVSKDIRKGNAELTFEELDVPISSSFFYWLLLPYWQRKINRRLQAYKGFVLIPQVLPSNWWAWMYKTRNRDVKVVWYCHEPSAFIHSDSWINAIPVRVMKWGARILNPLLKRVDLILEKENDMVICNSNFTKQQYKRVYGKGAEAVIFPPCRVATIQSVEDKENYILTVGRLSRFKNVDVLINALAKLSEELPEIRLIIAGEGEEKQWLQDVSWATSVKDRVCFEGEVSQERLVSLYKKARVTIICSIDEPFGLVPIESMMNGTPVIAHNSGGPKETISDGLTGFLYDNDNGLVELMKKVFRIDARVYTSMQQNCIEAAARYDVENAVVRLEKLLETVSH
jgi:glycosyltransferase involved in cell wall biosynthesis